MSRSCSRGLSLTVGSAARRFFSSTVCALKRSTNEPPRLQSNPPRKWSLALMPLLCNSSRKTFGARPIVRPSAMSMASVTAPSERWKSWNSCLIDSRSPSLVFALQSGDVGLCCSALSCARGSAREQEQESRRARFHDAQRERDKPRQGGVAITLNALLVAHSPRA
jgi:hypothetical protein